MNDPTREITDDDLSIDGRLVACVETGYVTYCAICKRIIREVMSPDQHAMEQWAYEHVTLHKLAGEAIA